MTDLKGVLDLVNKSGRIDVGRGKLYSTVATRVESLRLVTGDEYGIETEILHGDEDVVRMKCTVKDRNGRVVSTGHAEEIRGSSWINETSALEACETSAIGRALAALGIHGGEFASLNEVEGAESKRSKTSAKSGGKPSGPSPASAKSAAAADTLSTNHGEAAEALATPVIAAPSLDTGWATAVASFKTFSEECIDKGALELFWSRNRKTIDDMRKYAPDAFAEVKVVFAERAATLAKEKES